MLLSLLVAASTNHVIGINNTLPWHLSADLKYFKKLTTGHTIVMGRKTFDSIGKALPNRENIVLTHSKSFSAENVIVKNSIEEVLEYCKDKGEVFVIGGEIIFRQIIHAAHRVYLTRVHAVIENGDAFFEELNPNEWKLVQSEFHTKDEKNEHDYSFEVYERV